MKIETMANPSMYAIGCHHDTNHLYDGNPYSLHLRKVVFYFHKYKPLLNVDDHDVVEAACWTHDVIEDCRQTYNDVRRVCGEKVADIVYALTNEKGKNRKERANAKYYEGIRTNPLAVFVKLCDRLANVAYSKETDSRMIDVYRKEQLDFAVAVGGSLYPEMLEELSELLTDTTNES
jgi:(p)ppGpp synthase/HD superfamily hydrolase